MPTATPIDPAVQIREAIRQVSSIATLPEITCRVVATVEDPKSTAAQLHKIISHDPALVTRILKVVNSAFYGLPGQIGSVDRAIVMLGLNAVKNIALSASLGQLFRGVKLCDGYTAKDLWTHCVAVAVASRELARTLKLPILEEAFLAGMIHDVGMLVALQVHPDALRTACERCRTSEADFCETERQMIGVDHQQLGAALTEAWKFPRPCQLAAGYHHRPLALAAEDRRLTTIVYVADTLVAQQKHGFPLTAPNQLITPDILDELSLDPAVLVQVSNALPGHLEAAKALLG